MNAYEALKLYKMLARNQRLHSRRHPMFEKNKIMKMFSYLFISFWAVYLVALSVSTHTYFSGTTREVFDWVDGCLAWFLCVDFMIRFAMQETPAQNIKQYKLMNIPSRLLLNTFLLRMGLQPYNLFWGFYFVPLSLMCLPQYYGAWGVAGFLLGWWAMFMLNSYWYLLWRTLINRNILFVIAPVAFYAIVLYFGYFFDEDNSWTLLGSAYFMRGFCTWCPSRWLAVLLLAIPLYAVNYHLQKAAIYVEIAKTEVVKQFKTRNMLFLDKFGVTGEYIKLELRSTMRNLVVRKQFITGSLCMLALCSLLSFSQIYDNVPFMRVFICMYSYTCLGVMTLTTVMCAEGNYIDGLMVHKEMVLSLLKAKYYFQCLVLIIPFLFTIMPVAEGKMSILTSLGCLFFTSGAVFPFLFQLAVYNDSAVDLNRKLTRSGRDTKVQMLMATAALYMPMLVMYLLVEGFDSETAAWTMLSIGAVGTAIHPLWLTNIYRRFMARRYDNMEGFRSSR